MIIANWKMQKPYNNAIEWSKKNKKNILMLKKQALNTEIILCPSFDSLSSVTKILKNINIFFGAQNCASELQGAYTGEVSAESLSQLGVKYCIIGHSERRILFKENDDVIFKKLLCLINQNITPVLCIGENLEEKNNNLTIEILTKQLELILKNEIKSNFIIAYEPVWAIGTGITPKKPELEKIISWLKSFIKDNKVNAQILYGGSVSDNNVIRLLSVKNLEGFLLGGASLDFQSLKKIVLLYNNRLLSEP